MLFSSSYTLQPLLFAYLMSSSSRTSFRSVCFGALFGALFRSFALCIFSVSCISIWPIRFPFAILLGAWWKCRVLCGKKKELSGLITWNILFYFHKFRAAYFVVWCCVLLLLLSFFFFSLFVGSFVVFRLACLYSHFISFFVCICKLFAWSSWLTVLENGCVFHRFVLFVLLLAVDVVFSSSFHMLHTCVLYIFT